MTATDRITMNMRELKRLKAIQPLAVIPSSRRRCKFAPQLAGR